MSVILGVVGVALLLVIVVDQFTTILSTGAGSGVVASRALALLWRVSLATNRRWPSHRRLSVTGAVLLIVPPLIWIVGLWVGWSLIFLSSEGAVLESQSRASASGLGRVYYAGFSLFTLGLGDLHPDGDLWRLATAVASVMGLGMITLGVTYLVPVVQAASQSRQLARTVRQLGAGPLELVGDGSTDADYVLGELDSLVNQMTTVCEQHHTYDVLRYHHAREASLSLPVQVCVVHRFLRQSEEGGGLGDDPRLQRVRTAVMELAGSIARPSESTKDDEELLVHLLQVDGRTSETQTLGLGVEPEAA